MEEQCLRKFMELQWFFQNQRFILEKLIEIKGMLGGDVPYMEYSKIDISISRTSVKNY